MTKKCRLYNGLRISFIIQLSNYRVLTVEMEDRPGALSDILALLGEQNINLEYTYAFLTREKDKAYLVIKVADNAAAADILKKNGVKVICQDELETIFGD